VKTSRLYLHPHHRIEISDTTWTTLNYTMTVQDDFKFHNLALTDNSLYGSQLTVPEAVDHQWAALCTICGTSQK